MADGGFPNRCRADSALIIYRDAMRQYVAPIFAENYGSDWIHELVLTDKAKNSARRKSCDEREKAYERGTPAQYLIDLADIPHLFDDTRDPLFPAMQDVDIARMQEIRELRNELQHSYRPGDCTSDLASAIAHLCAAALEHCGLLAAANRVDQL